MHRSYATEESLNLSQGWICGSVAANPGQWSMLSQWSCLVDRTGDGAAASISPRDLEQIVPRFDDLRIKITRLRDTSCLSERKHLKQLSIFNSFSCFHLLIASQHQITFALVLRNLRFPSLGDGLTQLSLPSRHSLCQLVHVKDEAITYLRSQFGNRRRFW